MTTSSSSTKYNQNVKNTYYLICGFVRKCNINWNQQLYDQFKEGNKTTATLNEFNNNNIEHEWDHSEDTSDDDYNTVNDVPDSSSNVVHNIGINKRITDLILLWYFGTQDIKILFLDVDGVLNTTDDCMRGFQLNRILIERLANIIYKTQCKIVLSSDWRLTEKDKQDLFIEIKNKGNIDIVNEYIYIGDTPLINSRWARAIEIDGYLKDEYVNQMYNIMCWCAVDDRNLLCPLGVSNAIKDECFKIMYNHFVHTKEEDGLTQKSMNYIIEKLS